MAAKRATIAWINKLDDATLTASGLVSNLGIENAQVNPIGLPARKTGTAMTIDFDHGSQTEWSVIGLLGTNGTTAATIRVTLSNVSAGGVDVYDSGTVNAGIIAGYPEVYHRIDPAKTAQYGQIVFTDASVTFVDVGRLFGYGGAGYWQPTENEAYGRAVAWQDASQRVRTLGGQLLSAPGARWRTAAFDLVWNDEAEMLSNAFEADRLAGIVGDLLVMLDPANNLQKLSYWGPLFQVTPIQSWTPATVGGSLVFLARKRYGIEQRK